MRNINIIEECEREKKIHIDYMFLLWNINIWFNICVPFYLLSHFFLQIHKVEKFMAIADRYFGMEFLFYKRSFEREKGELGNGLCTHFHPNIKPQNVIFFHS